MALIVGLTGGIGSGKSICAKVFSNLGVPVFNSDRVAKEIVYTNPLVKASLIQLFGPEVFSKDEYNRALVASQVFNNKEKLLQLNAIIHPAVFNAFTLFCQNSQYPYVIKEAAILFESGSFKECNKIITVVAAKNERIERLIKRDALTKEEIEKRMQNQWTDEEKVKHSHFVIHNFPEQAVIPQILNIHETIIGQTT